jgi:hypothetical protein
MRKLIAMLTVMGVVLMPGFVLQLGCARPCLLTPDPDCDKTKLTNPCPSVCAENDGPGSEMSLEQGAADSGAHDGGAED